MASTAGTMESKKPVSSSFLAQNGLSVAFVALFLATWVGQALSGFATHNEELFKHGQPTLDFAAYLMSGHFLEATFENWESEFLQMGLFVLLTVSLRQKGSSESKDLEGEEPVDEDPRLHRDDPEAPWPVRRGGLVLKLYEHSLSIALLLLFAVSFFLHGWSGLRESNAERALHGEPSESYLEYITSSQFWFQSFQNWQSEMLAVASIVILSIFLRQRGSPQSKPVAASHSTTGE